MRLLILAALCAAASTSALAGYQMKNYVKGVVSPSCTTPWGATLTRGQSVEAYATASTTASSCQSETRTCQNGELSGSYQFAACFAQPPGMMQDGEWSNESCGGFEYLTPYISSGKYYVEMDNLTFSSAAWPYMTIGLKAPDGSQHLVHGFSGWGGWPWQTVGVGMDLDTGKVSIYMYHSGNKVAESTVATAGKAWSLAVWGNPPNCGLHTTRYQLDKDGFTPPAGFQPLP